MMPRVSCIITVCVSFVFQFSCENGRIILPLKAHEWNKFLKFSSISTVADFVSQWQEESPSAPVSRREWAEKQQEESPSAPVSRRERAEKRQEETPSVSVSRRERAEKRKTEVVSASLGSPLSPSSNLSSSSPLTSLSSGACVSFASDCLSQSKRLKYIKEGIDGQIERCRVGNHFTCSCIYMCGSHDTLLMDLAGMWQITIRGVTWLSWCQVFSLM